MPLTDYHLSKENYVTQLFAARFPFVNACALFFFRSGSNGFRRMIHSMKYSSRRDVAVLMGEIFGATLRESSLYDDIQVLVPIPLHWTKRMIRGYNQSEQICIGMSTAMGIPCDFKSVKRIRLTGQQAKRSHKDRWANVSGAFTVRSPKPLANKHILLVDDVLTTGSTLEACATEIVNSVEGVRLSIAALSVAKHTVHSRSVVVSTNVLE